MISLRLRLARWLLRGTGYHLRAGRKPKAALAYVDHKVDIVDVTPGEPIELLPPPGPGKAWVRSGTGWIMADCQ